MTDYLSLSTAVCDVIPLMEVLDEFRDRDYKLVSIETNIYCKAFEDNYSVL